MAKFRKGYYEARLVRDLLGQPAQGLHYNSVIQECYEHGSKWAIVLRGIDTGVRLEVKMFLIRYISNTFYKQLGHNEVHARSELPIINIMTKTIWCLASARRMAATV